MSGNGNEGVGSSGGEKIMDQVKGDKAGQGSIC